MMQLCTTSWHLGLGTSIANNGMFSTKTLGCAHSIHGNISTTKNHNAFTVLGGGIVFGEAISLHEVNAREIFVGKKDIGEIFTRNVEQLRQASTGGNVDGFVAHIKKLVSVCDATNNRVVLKLNTKFFEAVDLAFNDFLWQAKLRNAVDKHATTSKKRFEHSYIKTVASKLTCTGYARWTRSNNGNLLAAFRCSLGCRSKLGLIAQEAFELAYSYRFAFLTSNALLFTLVFLRANTTTNCRKH